MPDYSAGQAYLTVLPSLTGFGEKVREQLAKEDFSVDAPIKPKVDSAEAAKQGEEYGGAFGDAVRGRIEAALKGLPSPKIDADSSEADRKIAELRARLEELRGKQIGVDIDAATALAEIKAVKTELDELGRSTARVDVKADVAVASAELASVKAEVDDLKNSKATVNVDTSGAKSNINGLLLAGLALGPAIIPVAAAVAAALGAIGTGAIAGIAGLGVLKLGFSGVTQAVQALDTFQVQSAQNAKQNAAQQVSSANSIASAQDGVRNAVQGVADAERSAAQANENSARQVVSAQRGVADAMIATGISIRSALEAQTRAEQTLAGAQQQELTAQQALTNARQAAQRQLESLAQQVQDGALAERQAAIDIQNAQLALDQVKANPAASQLQREQAQLTFDQANQHLTDLRLQNKNLAEDKAAADKAGVDGSQQVVAAQNGVASANQAVANAQQGVADAAANLAEAQRAGAEHIAVAQEALATAQQQQAETARAGLESIQKAQESVIQAQRSLQNATVQAGAQGNAAMDALDAAMAKLTPTGQQFARFLYGLKPQFDELKAAAQDGLLPGVEDGIKSLLPYLPSLKDFIGGVATALGDMARQAGQALRDPFWQTFFGYIKDEAAPSIKTFGEIIGNLATGFAGLLEAFKPVWDEMGGGLKDLSQRFADFGKDAASGKSDSFNSFLSYVKQVAPDVKELLKQLGDLVGNIVKSMAGQGAGTLQVLIDILKWINGLPPGTIRDLIDLFIAYRLTKIAVGAVSSILDVVDKLVGPNSILSSLQKIRDSGGLKGALGDTAIGAGKLAGVVGAVGVADDLTGGGVGKTLNTLSGAPQAAPGTGSFSTQVGNLLQGNVSQALGSGPAQAGDKWDIRNLPKTLTDLYKGARHDLAGIFDGITGDANTSFGKTSDVIGGKSKDTTDAVKGTWAPAPGWLGVNWGQITSSAGDWWGRTKDTISNNAHGAYLDVTGKMTDLGGWLSGKWSDIRTDAGIHWQGLRDDVTSKASEVKDWVSGHIADLGTNVKNSFQWCVDKVQEIWGRLGDIAKTPINFVIDVAYNHGIVPLWNGIAGLFNLGKLGPMPLLAEGGVLPGYAPGRDTIPAVLSAGEGVLVPEAVRGLGADFVYQANAHFSGGRAKPSRGPNFAGGGVIDDLWGGVKSVAGAVVGGAKTAWDWFSSITGDVAGGVRKLFGSVFDAAGRTPGSGPWTDALKAIPSKLVDAVVAAAKNFASTITGGGALGALGSGAPFYVGQIAQAARVRALGEAGATIGVATSIVETSLRNLANPAVPDSLSFPHDGLGYDHDSIGLFQQRQAGWGTTAQRMNPFASAGMFFDRLRSFDWRAMDPGAAAQRVQVSAFPGRYSGQMGTASGLVRQYGGTFDNGGWLPPGLSVAYNGTGQHERVLTGPQWRTISNAARGGDGPQVTVHVHPRPEHDPAQIADMVSRRLSFAMRTGA